MRTFFDWFQEKQIDASKPWLILGKGPSFSLRNRYDLHSFHSISLNHAVREQKVTVAHAIDIDVIDDCSEAIENNAEVVVLPWFPHVKMVPAARNLSELISDYPVLQRLNGQGRLPSAQPEHSASTAWRFAYCQSTVV
ncbi:MAG: hypothetical protein WKF84_02935 [Pyrinomonadaceae bacterium]